MKDYSNYTQEEFMKLSNEEVAEIVKAEGRPKVGVVIQDGSRRAGMFFMNIKPDSKDFKDRMMTEIGRLYLETIRTIFDQGVETLILPIMSHENYNRNKEYVQKSLKVAFNHLFIGDEWSKFYNDYDVKVGLYGDIEYVKGKGVDYIEQLKAEVIDTTVHHKKRRIFWGIACSNQVEHARLMDMAVDFYNANGRKPALEEKFKMYYGECIEPVDFFIRATEIRDSGVFPPLVDAHKAQFYFLVAPTVFSLTKDTFRKILYDYLYCRTKIHGNKVYTDEDISGGTLNEVREFYQKNINAVIGLGTAKGKFWLPKEWCK